MKAKWVPAFAGTTGGYAGMTRYGGRRTGNFEGSDICRAMAAHGAVSATKDEAKLPPAVLSRATITECNIFLWII